VICHRFYIALVIACFKRKLAAIGKTLAADDAGRRSARGVYGISVTAELSGIDPQTLRLYERRGLITPARTDGGTRRYSDDDVARLARITELVDAGVNLAGVSHILDLQDRNFRLEADNARLASKRRP
jgi:MerR family transcriptional regulator, heat shock protein HspR